MKLPGLAINRIVILLASAAALPIIAAAQESQGPQQDPPPPAARPVAIERASGQKLTVPSGTRLAVVLENGISTRSAKAGDASAA